MKLITLFILTFFSFNSNGSKLRTLQWEVISSKDNITVYTPVNYKHQTGLVPIKYKAMVNHNPLKVLTVLADNDRKTEWMPNLKEVKIIEKKTIDNLAIYYKYDFPWPFYDREFVIQTQGNFDYKNKIISVNMYSIERQDTPLKSSIVRGVAHDGYTIIRSVSDSKTSIEMAFMNDFGGVIPKWIINHVQKKWPYRFISNLNNQLQKTDIIINPDFKKRSLNSSSNLLE